jgi:peptide/nickel transport system ATP-binding protein
MSLATEGISTTPTARSDSDFLLEIRNLEVSFKTDEGQVTAVDGVNLTLKPGQTLGVVGESGSGKSVTSFSVMRLLPKNASLKGEIKLQRKDRSLIDIVALKSTSREMCAIRGGEVAMIFQEPMSSFSPVHTIGNQITEAIRTHRDVSKQEAQEIAIELLDQVGISNPEQRFKQYPFELSGGMRQRAMIAVALSSNPSLLIADEPTTALDVTIQAQVLAFMKELREERSMAIIFITHNLGVIAQIADEVAVMYLGRVVEQGSRYDIFNDPKHLYTLNLLNAIPRIGKARDQRLVAIEGQTPSPMERPAGCPFHTRCPKMIAGHCDVNVPHMIQVGNRHIVACFLYE